MMRDRTLTSVTSQICTHGGWGCSIKVEVKSPEEPFACIANVTVGELKLLHSPFVSLRPRITWALPSLGSSSSCPTTACRFAQDSGIHVLQDPYTDMYDQLFDVMRPHIYSWADLNKRNVDPSNIKEVITYEAHVWRWNAKNASWDACCPSDPKIVNDGGG
jgi:hypothetical protein